MKLESYNWCWKGQYKLENKIGMRKWDMYSLKVLLKRVWSWKGRSWKVSVQVGKNRGKLKNCHWFLKIENQILYIRFIFILRPFPEYTVLRPRNQDIEANRRQDQNRPHINTYHSTRNFTLNSNLRSKFYFCLRSVVI